MPGVGRVVDRWRGRPFRYGETDCCQFVGELFRARHGRNPMDAFVYSGVDGASRIVGQYGSLRAAVTATLGEPRESVDDSRDGDVLLVVTDDGDELLAYNDRGLALVRLLDGRIAHLDPRQAEAAWGV